jgi:FAD/FMN-containing dehydrogenase
MTSIHPSTQSTAPRWRSLNEQLLGSNRTANRPVFKSSVSLYQFSPRAVVHPTSEAEIVQAVQMAARHRLKVRAIGALHSAAPIPATDGMCIVLDQYKDLVSVKGPLVTVQAGMRLWELNQVLAQHNLALPVLGTIVQQTVSGAISTGTHGGSLTCKSLSGYIHTLRLVRADGSVLELDRSHDLFNAVVISMGLLGIVSTVTFQCVPKFYLKSQVCRLPMALLLQQFDQIQRNHQYVDMRYSAITDSAHLVLIDSMLDSQENGGWTPTVKSKLAWKFTDSINKWAQRLFHTYRLNGLQRWCIECYDKTVYACPYGQSDFVLTHFDATSDDFIANGDLEDLDPVSDMEIAIPYSQATTALATIRNHFRTAQKYPSMHIHIRCSAADALWLSPAHGQAICWLEFWEYPRTGEFFREMVELLKPFNFRCHWGKQIPIDQDYLKQQYEKWDDFIRLRQEWDPNGMFSNTCLECYFGA